MPWRTTTWGTPGSTSSARTRREPPFRTWEKPFGTSAGKCPATASAPPIFSSAQIAEIAFPIPLRAGYAKFPNPASRYALVGVFVALVLELCGIRSLPFAVGLYLPVSTSTPIAAGGYVDETYEDPAVEARAFAALKERLKAKKVGETGYIYCMDRKGTVLASSGALPNSRTGARLSPACNGTLHE